MPSKVKKSTIKKSGPKKGVAYLTTRAMERAVAKGSKGLEAEAIALMGYTVREQDGWVVKVYANNKIEKISKILTSKRPSKIVLD